MTEFQEILNHISPYVIVTGSYACGTQTLESDIDFLIRERSDDERKSEAEELGIDVWDTAESYVKELIRYFESIGHEWSSDFTGSFVIDDTEIPLEFSAFYDIDGELFDIDIQGVRFIASKSNHTSDKYINGQKRFCV